MKLSIKPIPRSELSYAKMRLGNQNKYTLVIDGDAVIEWTGFGWIVLRPVQPEDRRKLPVCTPAPELPALRGRT